MPWYSSFSRIAGVRITGVAIAPLRCHQIDLAGGTSAAVRDIILKTNPKADFDVASHPEFLREGAAIYDFVLPNREAVGGKTGTELDDRLDIVVTRGVWPNRRA